MRSGHATNGRTCAHARYGLSCEELDRLRDATSCRCQICGQPEATTPHQQLHIDHDADVGDWAVRGLLCSRCNTMLDSHAEVLDGTAVADYLAAPWYIKGLGLAARRPDEPPIGTHLQLPNGAVIHRISEGWVWKTGPHPKTACTTWVGLWYHYGPGCLKAFDPPSREESAAAAHIRGIVSRWELKRDRAFRERDDTLLRALEEGRSQADLVRLTTYSRETVRQAVARARAHRSAVADEPVAS